MRELGVRELKQSLSQILHAVGRGEQIRVTLRGKPIADIVPAREAERDDRLRELVAQGRVQLPGRAHPARAPRPAPARRSASNLVLAERKAKR
ncbi:MAG: type II toxin-antitoxin system prevent-host-death family antitoxin [Actinobacteria bacterium]|nr:type II toxin-antitoxin system prevent-host-death family antitoxin [Actinomycetota bacterium]